MRNYVPRQGRDKLTWTLSTSGQFTVSSAYRVLSQAGKEMTPITSLWKTKATPSMRLFLYLMVNNRILTHDNMHRRNIPHPLGCVMCPHGMPETVMHLFFHCPLAGHIWTNVSAHVGFPIISIQDTILQTYLSSRPAENLGCGFHNNHMAPVERTKSTDLSAYKFYPTGTHSSNFAGAGSLLCILLNVHNDIHIKLRGLLLC